LYAGTSSSGIFRSTNGGASWGPLNGGLTNRNVSALATPRSYQPQVFVGIGRLLQGGAGVSELHSAVPAFDTDARADVAIYRPSTGHWFVGRSSDSGLTTVRLGSPGDVPVPGDYDGDGRGDLAVFSTASGVWRILRSSDGGLSTIGFGAPRLGDKPLPADYDG